MKAYKGPGGTAAHIPNSGNMWRSVVSLTPRPNYCRVKETQYQLLWGNCASELFWMFSGRENRLPLPGSDPGRCSPRPSGYKDYAITARRLHDHNQTYHTRYDPSGREISPTQRPLPGNTQHPQETDIHAAGGIRTSNPSKRAAARPLISAAINCGKQTVARYIGVLLHMRLIISTCYLYTTCVLITGGERTQTNKQNTIDAL